MFSSLHDQSNIEVSNSVDLFLRFHRCRIFTYNPTESLLKHLEIQTPFHF